jgi:DNA processing protein
VIELASGLGGAGSQPELDLGLQAQDDRRPAEQVRVLDALSTRAVRTTADVARRAGLATSATEGVLGLLALDGAAIEGDAGWRKQKG